MIEGFAFGSSDRRRVLCRPCRLGPALQQEDVFVWRKTARDGPLYILRTTVVTFDALRNVDQRVKLGVAEASGVLLIGGDFFVEHSST